MLEWLLANLHESKSKIKATLKGGGIKVNGKIVTQFDYPLTEGMKISVSKSKRNDIFKSRYVKIVYEDRHLLVIEKNIGILSMAGGHSSLTVKAVLDNYLHKSRQNCTAHVVHRLDRDTSGLMIYAKDIQTEQLLEHDWHNVVYDRRYVAVVSGEVENDEGTIANWLKDNRAYITFSSPWTMGASMPSPIFVFSSGVPITAWSNIDLRQGGRIKYVCIVRTWAIPSAATPNMGTATILVDACVSTPTYYAFIIPSRMSEWSSMPPSLLRS